MTNEIWKPVVGYEQYYMVSSLGRVKSLSRFIKSPKGYLGVLDEKILKQCKDSCGYDQVLLYVNKSRKSCLVHRLVAEAFIPNPHNYPQVNHKDEDKSNNSVTNLEWCDNRYNSSYGTAKARTLKSIGYQRQREQRFRKVLQYDLQGNFIKEYPYIGAASQETGVGHANITSCCKGKRHKAGGFIWRYAEDIT